MHLKGEISYVMYNENTYVHCLGNLENSVIHIPKNEANAIFG